MRVCCVTGHREIPEDKLDFVISELREEVRAAILEGFDYFISGYAKGADLIFARIVSEEIEKRPNIKLEAAIPYPGRLKTPDKEFQKLIAKANIVKICSKDYTRECFLTRDRYMVNHSERIIAVYDGRKTGGTYYTVKYAKSLDKDIRIINLS